MYSQGQNDRIGQQQQADALGRLRLFFCHAERRLFPGNRISMALLSGVHEIQSAGLVGLENGNWSTRFFRLGSSLSSPEPPLFLASIGRAGFLTLRKAGAVRQRVALWVAVAACISCEIAHWRGYVGLRHFAKM